MELSKDGGAELLSKCEIDPTVVAVTGVTGGSSYAIEHWENWCDSGIRSYHMKRNNAALSDGVSRMSPWIHYGMIATTRMVRDASSIGGKGAEKFLDEMLVFREHAQHHVHAKDNPDDWANIPGWAITSWNDRGPGSLGVVRDRAREGEVRRPPLGFCTDGTRPARNHAQQRTDDMGEGICRMEGGCGRGNASGPGDE